MESLEYKFLTLKLKPLSFKFKTEPYPSLWYGLSTIIWDVEYRQENYVAWGKAL